MPITHTTWAKGQSGNPGGRPRILEAVRDIARESTELAVETLRQICAVSTRQMSRVWRG